MNCDRAAGVRSALAAINGVTNVEVSVECARATVSFEPQKVRPSQFRTAIRVMGCEAGTIALQEEL